MQIYFPWRLLFPTRPKKFEIAHVWIHDPCSHFFLALLFLGTDLSKKHIRKSSSNSKITTGPAPSSSSGNENQICKQDQTRTNTNGKVRTIEIKRETESGSSSKDLHRSNSGSSDTSSGFGSLNNSDHPTQATPSGKLLMSSIKYIFETCGNYIPNWWVEFKLKCHWWVEYVPILGALTTHRALAVWITRIILRKQLLLVSYSCPVQIYFCDMWQLYAHMMSWVKNSRVSAPILGALTPHPALAAWITRTILRKQLLLVNYSYPSQIDFWDMCQVYAQVYELS